LLGFFDIALYDHVLPKYWLHYSLIVGHDHEERYMCLYLFIISHCLQIDLSWLIFLSHFCIHQSWLYIHNLHVDIIIMLASFISIIILCGSKAKGVSFTLPCSCIKKLYK
jgi:hypothetical protein